MNWGGWNKTKQSGVYLFGTPEYMKSKHHNIVEITNFLSTSQLVPDTKCFSDQHLCNSARVVHDVQHGLVHGSVKISALAKRGWSKFCHSAILGKKKDKTNLLLPKSWWNIFGGEDVTISASLPPSLVTFCQPFLFMHGYLEYSRYPWFMDLGCLSLIEEAPQGISYFFRVIWWYLSKLLLKFCLLWSW
jgi:hypothetical protein